MYMVLINVGRVMNRQNQTLKHQAWWWWWWWWRHVSLSMMPWTVRKCSTWHGMVMGPFWSNPYSSSASLSNFMNSGWFMYMTGITNLCCSSPCPTSTAKHPFGTSFRSFFSWWWWWKWRCGMCK